MKVKMKSDSKEFLASRNGMAVEKGKEEKEGAKKREKETRGCRSQRKVVLVPLTPLQ